MLASEIIIDIDNDLSWRKKEVYDLLNFVLYCSSPVAPSYSYKDIYYRSYILLIYAHLEWFLRFFWINYLTYIDFQKLKFLEIKDSYYETYLKKNLKINEKSAYGIMNKYQCEAKLYFQKEDIPTKSNVNYTIFLEILFHLGIEYNDFESSFKRKLEEKINAPSGINILILSYLYHKSGFKINFITESELINLKLLLNSIDYIKTIEQFLDWLLKFRNWISHWEKIMVPLIKIKPIWDIVLVFIDAFKDVWYDYIIARKFIK